MNKHPLKQGPAYRPPLLQDVILLSGRAFLTDSPEDADIEDPYDGEDDPFDF